MCLELYAYCLHLYAWKRFRVVSYFKRIKFRVYGPSSRIQFASRKSSLEILAMKQTFRNLSRTIDFSDSFGGGFLLRQRRAPFLKSPHLGARFKKAETSGVRVEFKSKRFYIISFFFAPQRFRYLATPLIWRKLTGCTWGATSASQTTGCHRKPTTPSISKFTVSRIQLFLFRARKISLNYKSKERSVSESKLKPNPYLPNINLSSPQTKVFFRRAKDLINHVFFASQFRHWSGSEIKWWAPSSAATRFWNAKSKLSRNRSGKFFSFLTKRSRKKENLCSPRYWERSDGRLLENGEKYRIANNDERVGYKAKMVLNITRINAHDLTMYHCISKNERGITKGAFTVYGNFGLGIEWEKMFNLMIFVEIDPSLATPPPIVDGSNIAIFGVQPPEIVSLEQLCPPPVQCPTCNEATKPASNSCSGSGFLFDLIYRWEIRQYGEERYPGFPSRSLGVLFAQQPSKRLILIRPFQIANCMRLGSLFFMVLSTWLTARGWKIRSQRTMWKAKNIG